VTSEAAPTGVPAAAAVSDFVDAMSGLAGGVALATTWLDGRPWGMTVTAFSSVSLEPPTVLVSLGAGTTLARSVDSTGVFGVSVLARRHWALARRGATGGASKFFDADLAELPGLGGSPAVAGALAHVDCEVAERTEVGDHVVFFGRVRWARGATEGEPLLYYRRAYRALARIPLLPNTRRATCPSS
jgi:flavin reductase ActVB